MRRRAVLVGLGASLAAGPGCASRSGGVSTVETGSATPREAFLFGFAVYEMMRTRANALGRNADQGRATLNAFSHRRDLSGPADRLVTAPNNDTLYSGAWLDLSRGPVRLTVPPTGDRYISVALMDLFSDHVATIRSLDGSGGSWILVGPEAPVSTNDAAVVRSPTNDAWLIVRMLVSGPDDVAVVNALQDRFTLEPAQSTPAPEPRSLAPSAYEFLETVNTALGRGPLPPAHAQRLARFRGLGIRPGESGVFDRLPTETRTAWADGIAVWRDALRGGLSEHSVRHGSWLRPAPGLAAFGTNDAYRASVALSGLGAVRADEATYLTCETDGEGVALTGQRRYGLRLPASVPADAFWSLTLYSQEPDGRQFLVENPIGRYAVSDRTPGLVRDHEGRIPLLLASERPIEDGVNWLPAPLGEYGLTFRAYRPQAAFSRFRLPDIVPLL